MFDAVKKNHKAADGVDEDITKVIEKNIFTVENKPLKFDRTNVHYNCSAGNVCSNQINMVEQAVHICCNGKTTAEDLELVEYRRPAFIPFSFPGWQEITDKLHSLTALEKIYGDENNEKNPHRILRT